MAFIRISVMVPTTGHEARVGAILDELIRLYQGKPGFITAYRLDPGPHAGAPRVGRISVWTSVEDTNRMASDQHDQSLQAELKTLVDEATHEEHSFEGAEVKA